MEKRIAYLAPEIPALSATFVYEEINALKNMGVEIIPFSVRKPVALAKNQTALSNATIILYKKNKTLIFLVGILQSFSLPGRFKALGWLMKDLCACRIFSIQSLKLIYQFSVAANLAKDLKKNKIDLLHIHFAHVPSQIGMYAAALSQTPYTITAHANDIFERGLLLRQKAERSAGFFTISEYNKQFLLSLGLPERKIKIVRCSAAFPEIHPLKNIQKKALIRIGTLGRLVEKKGIDVLIRAVELLMSEGINLKLTIAGDGPLKNELQNMINVNELQHHAEFVGSLNHDDVQGYLDSLDLFVLPCKKDRNGDMDGIPVVLMEAMARGTPVVSTKISGIPELVIEGKTGFLANPGDPMDLKCKIIEAIKNIDITRSMQWQAARHVHEEFGQSTNINRLLKYWNEI